MLRSPHGSAVRANASLIPQDLVLPCITALPAQGVYLILTSSTLRFLALPDDGMRRYIRREGAVAHKIHLTSIVRGIEDDLEVTVDEAVSLATVQCAHGKQWCSRSCAFMSSQYV